MDKLEKYSDGELFLLTGGVTIQCIRYDNGVWRIINAVCEKADAFLHTPCDLGTHEYLESLYQELKNPTITEEV